MLAEVDTTNALMKMGLEMRATNLQLPETGQKEKADFTACY